MSNKTSSWVSLALILIALVVMVFMVHDCTRRQYGRDTYNVQKTDTIYVNKVYRDTIRITEKAKPQTCYVYLPDTARRKRRERETIIEGVKITPRQVEIRTIDTAGIVVRSVYPVASSDSIVINNQGDAQIAPGSKSSNPLKQIVAGIVAVVVIVTIALTR